MQQRSAAEFRQETIGIGPFNHHNYTAADGGSMDSSEHCNHHAQHRAGALTKWREKRNPNVFESHELQ
jgi:hypothetical protein